MENTLINKQAFFALYFGQEVLCENNNSHRYKVLGDSIYWEEVHLELKPLSEISDEDAVEVTKLTYAMPYPNSTKFTIYLNPFNKKVVSWGDSHWQKYLAERDTTQDIYNSLQADYLRSKGYALPYMDLSVEQMVEFGWIKLTLNK